MKSCHVHRSVALISSQRFMWFALCKVRQLPVKGARTGISTSLFGDSNLIRAAPIEKSGPCSFRNNNQKNNNYGLPSAKTPSEGCAIGSNKIPIGEFFCRSLPPSCNVVRNPQEIRNSAGKVIALRTHSNGAFSLLRT